MKQIRVIQYGMGPIGQKVTQFLADRPGVKIVGAVDIDPAKVGKDVGELAGVKRMGVKICGCAKELMKKVKADVVVLTTASSFKVVAPQVLEIVSCGLSVVSTCEEMSYPWNTEPALLKKIDQAAKKAGVAVLATGVNPGFLMDFLPLALTGVCREVESVMVERIQDAQFRRLPFQQKIGAGLTVAEFKERIKTGKLRHVGLTESMHMIASKLGWKLDKTEDIIKPILAEKTVKTPAMTVEKGNALGVYQLGRGFVGKKEVIRLVFKAAIGMADPRDRVVIKGTPSIDSTVKGGVNGDIATCAIVVNAIPSVVAARPGLRTMADIEPVSCLR